MIRIGGMRPGQGLDIRQMQLLQQQAAPPTQAPRREDPSARELAMADVLANDPFRPTEAPGLLTGAARVAEMLMGYRGATREHEQEQSLLARELARQAAGDQRDAESHKADLQRTAALLAGDPPDYEIDAEGRPYTIQNGAVQYGQGQVAVPPRNGAGGAPPAGYRFTPDGNLEAIQGGPADLRQNAEGRARADAADSSIRQLSNAISVLNDLSTIQNNDTGFIGGITRNVPGTGAYDLNQALEPVRAILSFENLQEMRRNSTTGGALGSIAVRELELLGNTVRSLDTAQSPQQLATNIRETRAQLQRTLQALQAARQEMDMGPNEAPVEPMAPEQQGPRRLRWNPETQQLE